jgi:hypothetical protein
MQYKRKKFHFIIFAYQRIYGTAQRCQITIVDIVILISSALCKCVGKIENNRSLTESISI